MSWKRVKRVMQVWLLRALRCTVGTLAIPAAGCTLFGAEPNIMLSGQEEVPAVSTSGFGMGRVTVSKDAEHRIVGSIKVIGVEANAAHIHIGAVGNIGPPIVMLNKISSQVWSIPVNAALTETQFASYLAGGLYVNVHSDKFKGGEIRGQLRP